MRIRLISADEQLQKLCRETLSGFPGQRRQFTAGPLDRTPPPADLYIWDFEPELVIPADLRFSQEPQNIFLVHRQHIEMLWDELPLAAAGVLLKPVNPPTFRSLLEHTVTRYEARQPRDGSAGSPSPPSDRHDMLQCLLQANLRLEEYDQDRTNFISRAVHDFRAPLTAIDGYCGLLLSEELGPLSPAQSEILQRMHQSAKRLSRLSTAMLQLGAGRQMKRTPNLTAGDIQACISQAVHELTPLAKEKSITIIAGADAPPRPLYFDCAQIEQVLVNLLDNACRFTPRHGSIEIRGCPVFWERRSHLVDCGPVQTDCRSAAVRESNAFRVEVRDSGPGIPADHLEHIFEEYTSYRGGKDRSGAGLGLAICKMIVTDHQGEIRAEATGKGAVFSFVLPFVPSKAFSKETTPAVPEKFRQML